MLVKLKVPKKSKKRGAVIGHSPSIGDIVIIDDVQVKYGRVYNVGRNLDQSLYANHSQLFTKVKENE